MNDPQATQKQVTEELKNMAEGLAPLCVVTVAVLVAAAIGQQDWPR